MDGTTVSKFVHQLDIYFNLVDLKDDTKRVYIAVGLLEGQAHTWYQVQVKVLGWGNLKAAFLGYFKPADYTFKTRQTFGETISTLHGGCFMHCLLQPDALAVMAVM